MMSNKDREEMLRITPVIMTAVPKLGVRLLISYLRFRGTADKASKEIRNGMVQQGMPYEMADSLAREFRDETTIWKLMTRFGSSK